MKRNLRILKMWKSQQSKNNQVNLSVLMHRLSLILGRPWKRISSTTSKKLPHRSTKSSILIIFLLRLIMTWIILIAQALKLTLIESTSNLKSLRTQINIRLAKKSPFEGPVRFWRGRPLNKSILARFHRQKSTTKECKNKWMTTRLQTFCIRLLTHREEIRHSLKTWARKILIRPASVKTTHSYWKTN